MYHPYQMIRALAKHKSKKEKYLGSSSDPSSDLIMGLTPVIFLLILLIGLLLWIYLLYLLVKSWNQLPTWLKVIGILFLFMPPWASLLGIILITVIVKK